MAIIDPKAHYVCPCMVEGIRNYVSAYRLGLWQYERVHTRARPISGLLARQFIQDHAGLIWSVQQIASLVRLEHSGELLKVYRFPAWTPCKRGFLTHHDGQRLILEIGTRSHEFLTWGAALKLLDLHIARSRRGGYGR